MYEQTQAFPKTKLEFAEEFLEHFQTDVEKADQSVVNARAKLAAAQLLRDDAEENLRRERVSVGVATPEEILQDMKRTAREGGYGVSVQLNGEEPVVIAEAPAAVDPITGEVATPIAVADGEWNERTCQQCGGEGRLPDRTGGGHHRCKSCNGTGSISVLTPATPVVVVLYPGDDEPHVTEVGDRTRYAELVADYLTAAGIDAAVDADEWQVLAEAELTHNGGGGRNLTAPIQERDYGKRLIVAAADQGSVTGTAAEAGTAA